MQVRMVPGSLLLLILAIALVVAIVRLCSKRASVGAIVVLGLLVFLGLAFLMVGVSHQRTAQRTEAQIARSVPVAADPVAIWQPGIQDEFEANVYPSKLAAARALGLRIDKPIRQLLGDKQWPTRGIVFEGGHDTALLDEFITSANRKFPRTVWTMAPETVAVQADEVGIRLDLSVRQAGPAPWARGDSPGDATRGTLLATVLDGTNKTTIKAEFDEKTWIEDSDGRWNRQPNRRLLVAKSAESCLTRQEAEAQAIASACNQLTPLLRQTSRARSTPSLPRNVTPNDVLEEDFIIDRFSQKFGGRAGEIWRHALLIDASVARMEQLAEHKQRVARTQRLSWAKLIFSVAGLLALITITYVFLNAATKGYYTWSLRIAGLVLAAVVIILFVA